jgi:Fe-Mn family superoxide dismutase
MYPLFCLPVYEHAWMSAGFGVWGKEEWLKEFWTVLDWGKVSKAFEHAQNNMVRL